MDQPPKAPTGLRAPGKALWAAVVGKYVLTAGELEVLRQAARTADEVDRLERAVRALPDFATIGSTGQPRAHPLLSEVRAHRQLLERLWAL
jgi:plasmid stabilization system protein ParE